MLGIRWQLVPAAAAVAVLVVDGVSLVRGFKEGFGWLDMLVMAVAAVLLCLSALASILFPTISLPAPSGKHTVGTAFTEWVDEKTGKRLSVQVWYPANNGGGHVHAEEGGDDAAKPLQFGTAVAHPGQPIPFWWPVSTTGIEVLTAIFQMPSFLLSHLKYSRAHARLHAPLVTPAELDPLFLDAAGELRLPVIVSSHGFYGFKADRTHFCEDVASQGYVVVAADHVGDCSMAVYPDGTAIPFSAKLKPGDHEWTVRNQGLEPRMKDLSALFDRIERLASATPAQSGDFIERLLGGRVDANRIGAMGHSYGSATCIRFVQEDPRCKGVVALDPWLWPMSENCEDGIHTPLLVISSEFWDSAVNNAERRHKLVRNSHRLSHSVVVKDTKHHNFDDLPLLLGLPSLGTKMGFIGAQDPLAGFRAINELTRRFLEMTVLRAGHSDGDPALLDVVERCPLVHVEASSSK